ncbi:MAG: DUF4397 domain-containing protein [Woeseiaceae bacterium]|nr:DUF4397 domain-containing protein [Woeseiaceae bacterium]
MKFMRSLALVAVSFSLAACDSNDSIVSTPIPAPETFNIQALHASADAPAVNIILAGNQVAGPVDYKGGTPQLSVNAGTYPVTVEAITPSGTVDVIGPVSLSFNANTTYTIVAVGEVTAGSANPLEPVVLSQPRDFNAAANARVTVLHAAPNAPQVDVYATTPGADLTATAPLGTFSYKESLGPVEVPAADYQLRVTLAGDPTTVVYDSGTVPLDAGADLVISAVPSTLPGAAPISLVALDGAGPVEVADVATPTRLRVVHASPDAPAVDVNANGAAIVSDLTFPNVTGFLEVPADDYDVTVVPSDNPGMVVIDAGTLTLEAGVTYDVLATGPLASIGAQILTDDYRRVATAAKVRIFHASPTAQNVDIYVTAVGADINSATPAFSNIPFNANTGFVELPAGDYDVTVTPTGSKDAAIGPATISIANGGLYTAIAIDAEGGGTPLGLILADDFVSE